MRASLLILATLSATAFGARPALAQDRDIFTGPRVEVNAGYDSAHANDGIAATPNTLDGIRVGAAVGYDMPVGDKFTVGLEAGGGYTVSGDVKGQAGTTSYRATAGWDLDASLRLGFRASPTTLVYAKGGYANSEFRLRTQVGNNVTKISDNEDGWRVGAGIEQSLGDRFYAKAEYRYTDYGHDVSRHQGLIGFGYRF